MSTAEQLASTGGATQAQVTWSQKVTDFTFLLESGEELRCHKYVLVENSPVFDAMLTNAYEEAQKSQMSIGHFDKDTVIRFLQYLYAPPLPSEYKYRRFFKEEDLTLDLLKIGHFYQVEDLEVDCTEYLKENICDEIVMDVWMEAERSCNAGLCAKAIQHLVDRPKGKSLRQVPGFNEAFESHEKPLTDLLNVLADKNFELKEEVCEMRDRLKRFEGEFGPIKIIVVSKKEINSEADWTEEFEVMPLDKISTLMAKLAAKRPLPSGHWYKFTKEYSITDLSRNRTFEANNIRGETTLRAYMA